MIGSDSVWVVCRFLHDSALVFLWGAFAYLAWCVPEPLSAELAERLRSASVTATGVLVATSAVALPVQTALIGNGWVDALDGPMLWSVLRLTSAGREWLVEAAGCALLVGAARFSKAVRPSFLAVVSGLMLAGLALNGHAAMKGGTIGTLHRLNDILHVLAGGAWVGALVPFLYLLHRCDILCDRAAAMLALRRFSSVGHVAVALVLVSGVLNVALVLGRLPTDWRSPYQAKLMLKIAIVMVMTSVAILNRYLLVPRMAAHRQPMARALKLSALVEIGLGLAAIALVAAFGTKDPV
ncbi:copper homeostasis membrane protein CopD [Rhizobium sp. BK251]|uniref:copper homeostasis membrane protein CopD n=1 Tax=Rhizobium sp. BK251 TaxID=2512125 RepID=UPI00104768B6|nr:copper homeostasis membrane protein CopD [Rhizobium sp. BK251]TCL75984.1 putative copper resistance protein D [Rhizobium sp. BK251]